MARTAGSIPYATTVLRQRSTWLIQQMALLKKHVGVDSIHDTRVQSRRMRAALEAFQDLIPALEWQPFYDSVRKITRALGEIRETEVMGSLIEVVAGPEDLGEQVAREYLEEKLQKRMRRLRRRLGGELSRTDLRRLRSRVHRLIGSMSPSSESELERARRVLGDQAAPILSYSVRSHFDRASDRRLHKLRIAAKKLRYTMEIFDPCWPGGLKEQIATTRALQDAGGYHQDWTVVKGFLEREIDRLLSHRRHHLAAQISRLLTSAREKKSELRAQIQPALRELRTCLKGMNVE